MKKRGPKRRHSGMFKPGQSGNPGGRSKNTPQDIEVIYAKFRELTPQVAEELGRLLDHSDPRIVMRAAELILHWGLPKPPAVQHVDITMREEIKNLTNEQLIARAKAIFGNSTGEESGEDANVH